MIDVLMTGWGGWGGQALMWLTLDSEVINHDKIRAPKDRMASMEPVDWLGWGAGGGGSTVDVTWR